MKRRWIPLTEGRDPVAEGAHWVREFSCEDQGPDRRQTLLLKGSVPGLWHGQVDSPEGSFDALSIPGAGHVDREGKPDLPLFAGLVALPLGARVEGIEAVFQRRELEGGYKVIPGLRKIPLTREAAAAAARGPKYWRDPEFYGRRGTGDPFPGLPESVGVEASVVSFLGRPCLRLRLPLAHSRTMDANGAESVSVVASFQLRITVGLTSDRETEAKHFSTFPADTALAANVLGSELIWGGSRDNAPAGGRGLFRLQLQASLDEARNVTYLAICGGKSQFSGVEALLAHRAREYPVAWTTVTDLREAFPGLSTQDAIREALRALCAQGSLERVFLVGSAKAVPMYAYKSETGCEHYEGGKIRSDHYYADLSGDNFPDLVVARLPFDDPEDLKRASERILTQSDRADQPWAKKLLLHAVERDESFNFEYTKDGVAEICRDCLPCEKIYDSALETPSIREAINGGCGILNYFGHGDWDIWSGKAGMCVDELGAFQDLHRSAPSIFALSCRTAGIWKNDPSIGGELVRRGLAAAYVGATDVCWGTCGEVVQETERLFFEAITKEGRRNPAECMASMKAGLAVNASATDLENIRLFVTLGDPGMRFLPFETGGEGEMDAPTAEPGGGEEETPSEGPDSAHKDKPVETVSFHRRTVSPFSPKGKTSSRILPSQPSANLREGRGEVDVRIERGDLGLYDAKVGERDYLYAHPGVSGGFLQDHPGKPLIPQEGTFVELPPLVRNPKLTVKSVAYGDKVEGVPLPAPRPTLRLEGRRPAYAEDEEIYAEGSTAVWPPSPARIAGVWPGQNRTVVLIQTAAMEFRAAERTCLSIDALELGLEYETDTEAAKNTETVPLGFSRYASANPGRVLRAEMVVPDGPTPMEEPEMRRTAIKGRFLMLASKKSEAILQPLLDRKMREYGDSCVFAAVEDIGADADAIRTYISEAMETWEEPPEHVLLVGDYSAIPAFKRYYAGGEGDPNQLIPSDFPYSDLSGDGFPDVPVSRLPYNDRTALEAAIEAGCLLADASGEWAGRALLIADPCEADQASMDAIEAALEKAGYASTRLGEEHSKDDVKAALRKGVAYGDYSGHGSGPAWCTTGYSSSTVPATDNLQHPPGIISISCTNNCIDEHCPNALGPVMVGKGRAAHFISGVRPTWYGSGEALNQYFTAALLKGNTAAEALTFAKIELLRNYGDDRAKDDAVNYTLWGLGDVRIPAPRSAASLKVGDSVRALDKPYSGMGRGLLTEEQEKGFSVLFEEAGELAPFIGEDRLVPWEEPAGRSVDYDLHTKGTLIRALSQMGYYSSAKIDPLPHQIIALHHFLHCDTPRRLMLADDVGLGKTIEAGLIIKLLIQRSEARRVLILTPAGLTLQWKSELERLDFLDRIDVLKDQPDWELGTFDYLIASIDRVKETGYRKRLEALDDWDLVVVDEAHALSREAGKSPTLRYRVMAESILPKSRDLLLLTATPHTGRTDRLIGLLDLLSEEPLFNPLELKARIGDGTSTVMLSPREKEVIQKHFLRRQKSDAVYPDGSPIFFKRVTTQVPYVLTEDELAFREALDEYLGRMRQTAVDLQKEEVSGKRASGYAMALVEVAFHKIADSSLKAIERALRNRLHRFDARESREQPAPAGENAESESGQNLPGIDEPSGADAGGGGEVFTDSAEQEEEVSGGSLAGFMDDEDRRLKDLLQLASAIPRESKMTHLLRAIAEALGELHRKGGDEVPKFIVFVEYRATLEAVAGELQSEFGTGFAGDEGGCVVVIHGGMSAEQKVDACERFRSDPKVPFLVSTSAGAEGVNLQCCHILFNYDLPWNPFKMEQRIGRIHRYGNHRTALIYNFLVDPELAREPDVRERVERSSATVSSRIVERLLTRLRIVANDLIIDPNDREVFENQLREMILGETTEREWNEVFLAALDAPAEPLRAAEEVIEQMLAKAKRVRDDLGDPFGEDVAGNHEGMLERYGVDPGETLHAFMECFMRSLGSSLQTEDRDGVFTVAFEALPDEVRQRVTPDDCRSLVFRGNSRLWKEGDRIFGAGHPLFDAILDFCASPQFGGKNANVLVRSSGGDADGFEGVVFNFRVRLLTASDASNRLVEANVLSVAVGWDYSLNDAASRMLRFAYGEDWVDARVPPEFNLSKAESVARERIESLFAGSGAGHGDRFVREFVSVSRAIVRIEPPAHRAE